MSELNDRLDKALEGHPGNRTLSEITGTPVSRPKSRGLDLDLESLAAEAHERERLIRAIRDAKHHSTADLLRIVLETVEDKATWEEHIHHVLHQIEEQMNGGTR